MNAFDRIRSADAQRRVQADVRALVAYSALAVAEPETEADALPTTARWAGPIGMEDELTGDGRAIEGGALSWDVSPENPAPMRFVRSDVGLHDGAVVVGNIESISRRDGGVIWGEGDFDMASEEGREAFRLVKERRQNGVSMDLDDVSFEIRIASELMESGMGLDALFMGDEEGEEMPTNDDGTITVATINSDDEVMLTTGARVRAATIVAVPAFANARIDIVEASADDDEDVDATPPGSDELAAIRAGGFPVAPPREWFTDQHLSGPTPLTVTKDGHVFGHLALWGTCHASHTAGGNCVTPPNSATDYAHFHTGALVLSDGSEIAVGHLTMGTGHASETMSAAETARHYDNTGSVAADVRAYEDGFGIAVTGGMRPGLSDTQVREFRAAPLSGDWRRVGTALELHAALSVNVPGFGVPRPAGLVAGGNLQSLVASGIVVKVDERSVSGLSDQDVRYLRSFIARERRGELDALAARRNRVRVAAFARRRNKKG
ncbi:capsid maturation protease [Microbacterium phage Nicole72]|uniref:Capsid maturation protease n=1 Tax=Microbacterium phage Nicole72 TaxID=3062838 RepID=A0ACD4UJQ9_9CAUD|nr:capsid maturation protease [Microbacterium phage Nicole72]